MKICISDLKFNPTLLQQPNMTQDIAINEFGYQVVEIPDNCYNCAREDFDLTNGHYTFNKAKYDARIERHVIEKQQKQVN